MAGDEVSDGTKPLTPVVFHTLLALANGPLHGYAISQEVEVASNGGVRMGPGTLYGSLQRMQASGYVEETDAVESEASHEGRRRYYALTAAGRRALEAEAARLERAVSLARERHVLGGGSAGR